MIQVPHDTALVLMMHIDKCWYVYWYIDVCIWMERDGRRQSESVYCKPLPKCKLLIFLWHSPETERSQLVIINACLWDRTHCLSHIPRSCTALMTDFSFHKFSWGNAFCGNAVLHDTNKNFLEAQFQEIEIPLHAPCVCVCVWVRNSPW